MYQKGLPLRSPLAEGGQTQVLILAGIVILLLVAGGIFFLGRITAPKSEAPVTTSSPQPSPTTDPNVNWKTYTNARYGFSFKYPENLSIRSDSRDDFIGFLEIPGVNNSQKLIVSVYPNPNNLNLQDFREDLRRMGSPSTENVTYQPTTINGYAGLTERYERACLGICEDFKSGKYFMYHIKDDRVIVSFSIQTDNPAGNILEDEQWLDQILSTFKFLP
jgi:hypothetical protein